jgi:cytosine/adenosine deaminase-related metal-dependent hydrolase
MSLLLKNLSWHNGKEQVSGDVRIKKGVISEIATELDSGKSELVANFKNHFLYPGLINAHDHLEMNLYPKLGSPPYANYVDWARDIYHPTETPIREIEKISISDRLLWGGFKNLISGATSVIHHNPWHRVLAEKQFPVNVLKVSWAHSLAFEKKILKKLHGQKNAPFVIHAGEGIDEFAHAEIRTLGSLNALRKNTVLVHAIALQEIDLETVFQAGSSVVWCPASNFFMFGQTTPIEKIKNRIRVALGTDSTLTGSPTLLHEMQQAKKTDTISANEIYDMVTTIPAQIFNLPEPLIAPFQSANLFIAARRHANYYINLLHTQPADISLVLKNGVPRLKDLESDGQWAALKHHVTIQGVSKYCDIDVSQIRRRIEKKVNPSILEKNPLWKMVES